MKKKKQKKLKLSTLLVIVIIAALLTMWAAINTFSKYVIADEFTVDLSNYYLDITSSELEENEAGNMLTTTITVKNHDGTNYMTENIEYTISVEGSEWMIRTTGGLTRTLTGGEKNEDSFDIEMALADFSGVLPEQGDITLVVTVNYPYPDTKTVAFDYDNRTKLWNFAYTGDYQEFVVPYDGTYKIETWGAEGGSRQTRTTGTWRI